MTSADSYIVRNIFHRHRIRIIRFYIIFCFFHIHHPGIPLRNFTFMIMHKNRKETVQRPRHCNRSFIGISLDIINLLQTFPDLPVRNLSRRNIWNFLCEIRISYDRCRISSHKTGPAIFPRLLPVRTVPHFHSRIQDKRISLF